MELKIIEEGIIPIYENTTNEKLVNARELHLKLGNKRQFANWIKQRIEQYDFLENQDFICFNKFVKANKYGNKSTKEYYRLWCVYENMIEDINSID
ncbi:MAG: antA/AntB antirepressor family protein [Clostridia bacterium]